MKESLATVAVRLLAAETQPEAGARRAIALKLAGLYQQGLQELGIDLKGWEPALVDELARARGREIGDAMIASRAATDVLAAILESGVRPVVLKGRSLAERLWPTPWMRPTGDLDLLVEEHEFGTAVGVLARLDYRPGDPNETENGRWRQGFSAVHLGGHGPGRNVDVHARLFRTVGAGIATRDVLRRATPASVLGAPVRVLEPGDEILFLVIHAAKHGTIHPKWILDLHAARLRYPPEAWAAATDRAVKNRATRPFWAVARLIQPSPAAPAVPAIARTLIPRFVYVSPNGPHVSKSSWARYPLEWLLEDRLSIRLQRSFGVLHRWLAWLTRRFAPCGVRSSAGQLRNQRWLEGVLRAGRTSPLWVRLKGASMVPSMHPGDLLLVTPVATGEQLAVGSVYVARRSGRLFAHRYIRPLDDTVVMRGDALAADDPPIPLRDVLGRVIAVHRSNAPTKRGTDGPE